MRLVLIVLALAAGAWAQSIPEPKPSEYTITLLDPSGPTGSPTYVGKAFEFMSASSTCSNFGNTCVKRSDSTLTSIVDSGTTSTITTANAHGYWVGQRVKFSGATVANALNGTYTILTTPSSTTATVATAGVADATYNESTLMISTMQPLTTQAVWSIQILKYDASNYLISTSYAIAPEVGSSWKGGLAWANRTAY